MQTVKNKIKVMNMIKTIKHTGNKS